MEAHLLALETVEAPHPALQQDVRRLTLELFAEADFERAELAAVFDNAGILRRTLALPLEAYAEELDPESRNRHFLDTAHALLTEAAWRAVPRDLCASVTHVVTVTSTGIATPSLECAVIEALELNPDARRVPLFGLGCAGGVAGLQLARELAAGNERALVLVLCVELTSLTLLTDDLSRRNFVACALFGDGAAAALVAGTRAAADLAPLATLHPGLTRLFPGTRDLMGWDVREQGWAVTFSPRIPLVIRKRMRELALAALGERGLEGVRHFALHPGGRKVLEAYRDTLELTEAQLAPATRALARHGNMSAASVFFVLEELLRAPDFAPGLALTSAFGPGFTAELATLDLHAPLPG